MIEIESQPENIVPMSGLFPYKRPDGRTAYVILLSDELAAKIFSEED